MNNDETSTKTKAHEKEFIDKVKDEKLNKGMERVINGTDNLEAVNEES